MEALLYLAKSSLVLLLFYLVYIVFLRKETHFVLNRYFLLLGLVIAIVLPILYIPVTTNVVFETNIQQVSETVSMTVHNQENSVKQDYYSVLLTIYFVGVFVMFVLFVSQLFSVLKLIVRQPINKKGKYNFVETHKNILPFSFFNYIVYNPSNHSPKQLEVIITHEKQHINQKHSIDTLCVALYKIVFWFNPVVWLYEKEIQRNLEFLADKQAVVNTTLAYYQEVLVNSILKNSRSVTLTASFYQSLIKKRIVMLNTSNSKPVSKFKVLLVLPLLAIFLLSFNIKEKTVYQGFLQNKKVFVITETTSDNELEDIKNSINKEGKIKIDFLNLNRESGKITKITLATSPDGTNFKKRMSLKKNKNGKFTPFSISLNNKKDGIVFKDKVRIVKIYDKTLKAKELDVNLFGSEKRRGEEWGKSSDIDFGIRPLYVLNGEKLNKNKINDSTVISLDGEVRVLDKEEGLRKYGKDGKDGVLELIGNAIIKGKKKDSIK